MENVRQQAASAKAASRVIAGISPSAGGAA